MILNLNIQCIELISDQNILEPNCAFLSPKAKEMAKEERARRSLREKSNNFILPSTRIGDFWCKVNLSLSLSLSLALVINARPYDSASNYIICHFILAEF